MNEYANLCRYGIEADFLAADNCSVMYIKTSDIQEKPYYKRSELKNQRSLLKEDIFFVSCLCVYCDLFFAFWLGG